MVNKTLTGIGETCYQTTGPRVPRYDQARRMCGCRIHRRERLRARRPPSQRPAEKALERSRAYTSYTAAWGAVSANVSGQKTKEKATAQGPRHIRAIWSEGGPR